MAGLEQEYVVYDPEKFTVIKESIAEQKRNLLGVLTGFAVPDPKLVGKLPKGNVQLDFVGHADITRILIEIDPTWEWQPVGWENGRPQIHVENGMATMWGELTLLGHSRLGVGSCRADKQDLDKELVSDFLRNAAMRFGIALSLWTKQEWEDLNTHPAPAKKGAAPKKSADDTALVDPAVMQRFIVACQQNNLDHDQVADVAGVDLKKATVADMNKLRAAFNQLGAKK